jgi:hypothetical protein
VLEVSAECEERRRIDAWQHDRARQSDRDSESLDTQRTDQTDKLEELHRWMAARIKQH